MKNERDTAAEAIQQVMTDEYGRNIIETSDKGISKRKKAGRGLRWQSMLFKAISQVYGELVSCETMEEMGNACLEVVERLTGSEISFIGEIGEHGLFHDIAVSMNGWEACEMYDKSGHRLPPGNFPIRGLFGKALRDAKTVLANDPSSHPDSIGVPEGHPLVTSILGVPILHGKKVVGMVAVANRKGGYTEEEKEILEALTPTILEVLLHKRAEISLRQSDAHAKALVKELEEVDRNKNEFLSALSHELRNPISVMSGGLQLMDMRNGYERRRRS